MQDLQKHLNECPDYHLNQLESTYYQSVIEEQQPTMQLEQEFVGDDNWGKPVGNKTEIEHPIVNNDQLMKELAQLSDGIDHLKVERKNDIWD